MAKCVHFLYTKWLLSNVLFLFARRSSCDSLLIISKNGPFHLDLFFDPKTESISSANFVFRVWTYKLFVSVSCIMPPITVLAWKRQKPIYWIYCLYSIGIFQYIEQWKYVYLFVHSLLQTELRNQRTCSFVEWPLLGNKLNGSNNEKIV